MKNGLPAVAGGVDRVRFLSKTKGAAMARINTAAKGRRLEHKTIKLLESAGYRCTRAAASKGVWDIIAIGPVSIRLIQVKANGAPGPLEREQMELFEAPPNVTKEYWVWVDKAREPIIKTLSLTKKWLSNIGD